MTLKISVGLSKKVGQPNYSSLGASCQIEMEIDTQSCQGGPLLLQTRISEAFGICKASIENELALERYWVAQTHMPTKTKTQTRQPPEPGDTGLSTRSAATAAATAAAAGGVVVPGAAGSVDRVDSVDSVEAGAATAATSVSGVAGVSGVAAPIRSATRAQVRALERIADQAGVELTSHVQREFGVRSVDQLTIRQASAMIDRLKALLVPTSR